MLDLRSQVGARWALLVAALAVASYYNIHFLTVGTPAMDYRVFAEAVRLPLDQVYEPRAMPFSNPPTALLLLAPLRWLDPVSGYWAWIALSAMLFAVAVVRLAGSPVAGLSLLSFASVHALVLGQVVMLLTAILALALTLPSIAGGVLIAVVGAVKPQLVLFAPLAALVRRDWWMLAGMAGGAAALLLAALGFYGFQPWIEWVESLPAFYAAQGPAGALPAMLAPVARAAQFGLPVMVAWVGAGLLGAVAVIRLAPRIDGAWLLALIVGASLAASPYALAHDSLGLAPASVLALTEGPLLLAVAAVGLFGGPPLAMVAALTVVLALGALGFSPRRAAPTDMVE